MDVTDFKPERYRYEQYKKDFERNIAIWGEATSLAADSKKLSAWDQNLLTEWHIRYRGPGIMVYWHVERKALCIYSQIKRCSSSEVAAMI